MPQQPPIQEDFFTKVTKIHFGGNATEAGPGSLVQQSPANVADSFLFTLSMWVRTDTDAALFTLSDQTGNRTGVDISVLTSGGSAGILLGIAGVPDNINMDDNITVLLGVPPALPFDTLWTPFAFLFADASPFIRGAWNHVFVAVDLSTRSTCDNSGIFVSGPTVLIYVNGEFADGVSWAVPQVGPPGKFFPTVEDTLSNILTCTVVQDNPVTPTWAYKTSIPPWRLSLTGAAFGLPLIPVFGNFDTVDYAAVQCWVGKFIDPQNNIGAFITADKKLVKPDTAQKAFGKSQYLLDGPPKNFAKNKGSAGPVVVDGTLDPAKPYPKGVG